MLIKSIENIQKRFTKKIANNSCLSYSSCLQLLGLHSLELRRLKHDLVICFKIMHNLVCIDKNLFFEINNNNYVVILLGFESNDVNSTFANIVFLNEL